MGDATSEVLQHLLLHCPDHVREKRLAPPQQVTRSATAPRPIDGLLPPPSCAQFGRIHRNAPPLECIHQMQAERFREGWCLLELAAVLRSRAGEEVIQ